MELTLTENTTITNVVAQAHTHIGAASLEEILCVLVIPLLAWFIGARLNRLIDKRPQTNLTIKIIDFTAPLLAPTLAIFLSFATLLAFRHSQIDVYLLPFIVKLAISWFAVQLVILMSNRQSAGWVIACFIIPITLLHLFDMWDVAMDALTQVAFSIGSVKLNLYSILKGITVIFVLQWLASFAVRTMDSRLSRIRDMRASNRTLIVKIFQILLYCFVFVMGMQFLGISLAALSVFGGALGVGLGFGLQKIASNFISGIILLFEKSIEIGDLIELTDGTNGFVRQTNARYTLLETQDGKELMIPNEEFINQRVISWTHTDNRARAQISINVSYDSDIDLARKLMLEAAAKHPKRTPSREPLCVVHAFGESGVELHLYFWVADVTDGRMEPRSDIMLGILKAFKANDISIPYPQRELRVTHIPPVTTGSEK